MMVQRTQKLSQNNSFFLFGARGTGKTTLLRQNFPSGDETLWIDLLTETDEERYGRHPDELSQVLKGKKYKRVIIDEVQKAPKILDIVHYEIEKNKNLQFILTGSSARKLKRGSANLLAGRAFTYSLFPLTHVELEQAFNLKDALTFGTLPQLLDYTSADEKNDFLRAYIKNYLREEIQIEQLVRQLHPFRNFLEIAAQSNGTILNYAKISRDVGVDDKTVVKYFSILEDTLIGFYLPSFHRSIRKQQQKSPKFYFFDTGVTRALSGQLRMELLPKTYAFGNAFEHWVILECYRLCEYKKLDYKFSYLMTKDNVEIDLIVERPGESDLLIEIKSASLIRNDTTQTLKRFQKDWDRPAEAQIWSLDVMEKKIDGVTCLYWQTAMKRYF